jgi:crossover junction endodeoxyribonuclease RusA
MIRVTLPYPPSANNMFAVVRGRKIKSKRYREWCASAAAGLCAAGRIAGGYRMTASFDRPDRRARDIDNLIKPVSDALKTAGLIEDDSKAQSIAVEWSSDEPVKPAFVRVTLEALAKSKGEA